MKVHPKKFRVPQPTVYLKKIAASFVALGATLCLLQSSLCYAESLVMHLRVIKARGAIQSGTAMPHLFDKSLKDIAMQLQTLPFAEFSLVKKMTRDLQVKQKVMLDLCAGQRLAVRPLYMDGNKIGLWLRWDDADNTTLLDTRLHLDVNQAMLVGSEEDVRQTGKVLALTLERTGTHDRSVGRNR